MVVRLSVIWSYTSGITKQIPLYAFETLLRPSHAVAEGKMVAWCECGSVIIRFVPSEHDANITALLHKVKYTNLITIHNIHLEILSM